MNTVLLFVPGNNPAMVQNAGILGADTLIFDLEDAVAQAEKDAGRKLLKHALKTIEYPGCDLTVRINSTDTPHWKSDITDLADVPLDGLVVPKIESASQIEEIEAYLEETIPKCGFYLIPLIETAKGVENVYEILQSSSRIKAVFFGAEDYTANVGSKRTKEGHEILYARNRIVNAAAASMVQAIDTPFTDTDDLEGLKDDVSLARSLGFSGKASISPRHCQAIKEGFAPTLEEIDYAERVIRVVQEAERIGLGVISLNGKMIDKPIVMRAERVLSQVGKGGTLNG